METTLKEWYANYVAEKKNLIEGIMSAKNVEIKLCVKNVNYKNRPCDTRW